MPNSAEVKKSTSNFDDIAAEDYDNSIPVHVMEHLTQRRVEVIEAVQPAGKFLDVGCGTGMLLAHLPKNRYERYGIDLSEGMLRQATAKDATLHVQQASSTEIPFEDNYFDVVFCAAMLHHVATPIAVAQTIAEMIRVTKPGGTTIIWDHNPANPYWPIIMSRVPQDIGEERLVPRKEIEADLAWLRASYNFEVEWRQMTFIPDFAPKFGMGVFDFFERLFEKTPVLQKVSAHNVAIVNKLKSKE